MLRKFSVLFENYELRIKKKLLRFENVLLILLALSVCISEPFSRNIIRIIFVMIAVKIFIGKDTSAELIKHYKFFLLPISAFAWWMIISSIYGGKLVSDSDSYVYWFFFSHNMILFIPMTIMIRQQKNSEKLLIAMAISLLIDDIFIAVQLATGVGKPITFLNDSPLQNAVLYVILLPMLLILTLTLEDLRKQIFFGATFFISLAAFLSLHIRCAELTLLIIFASILLEGIRHYKKILLLVMTAGIIFFMSQVNFNNEDFFYTQNLTWSSSVEIILNHPIMGVGLGNYNAALTEIFPQASDLTIHYAFNTYLQFWSETGIFGLILFCSIFGEILIWSEKRSGNLYGRILFFSTLSLMLYATTDFIFESYSAMRAYWFLFGICVASLHR